MDTCLSNRKLSVSPFPSSLITSASGCTMNIRMENCFKVIQSNGLPRRVQKRSI